MLILDDRVFSHSNGTEMLEISYLWVVIFEEMCLGICAI